MNAIARSALLGLLAACSPTPASPPAHPATAVSLLPTASAKPAEPPPIGSSAPLASSAPLPPAPPPLVAAFHREIADPVTAIALEAPPHAAALGASGVFLHDARGWRSEPLPTGARPSPSLAISLFYGRDNRVRLIGTRAGKSGPEGVYLRWLPAGFKREKSEIGRLSDPRGALVAVLGTAEPEIVCRPGDVCLVKRRSGWSSVKAPPGIERVVLGGGAGWAVAGQTLLRLGDDDWHAVGSPGSWQTADALFATREKAWIVETTTGQLHHFDGAAWQVSTSPLAHPHAIWGATAEALWLVADEGLAFFDGTAWRRVPDAPAPLLAVLGRSADDVWVGGGGGLFRIEIERRP
ncbi:MAG: hypothetical protein ABJE95_06060 [Byssovorax sp.]